MVSTDDFLNTNNNETEFPEITRVSEEAFDINVQELSVLNYLNFRTFQSPLGFSVDKTHHIMGIVNECFPTVKFRNIDTPFRTYYTYEKELMACLLLTIYDFHKAEIEYHGKFGHTLVQIHYIAPMSIIDIDCTSCCLATQIVIPTLPDSKLSISVLNICLVTILNTYYPYKYYDGLNVIRITWSGNQVEDYKTHFFI